MRQRVSGPVLVVVMLAVLLAGFLIFGREELAPPGVGVHQHGEEEETMPLPWSPPTSAQEMNSLRKGLLPLGVLAVYPPLGEDRGKGARLAGVRPGSPAGSAGLEPGDLLKSFDGRRLSNPWALVSAVENASPEKKYEIVVVRAGEERKVLVAGIIPLPPEERVR